MQVRHFSTELLDLGEDAGLFCSAVGKRTASLIINVMYGIGAPSADRLDFLGVLDNRRDMALEIAMAQLIECEQIPLMVWHGEYDECDIGRDE